MKVRDEVYTQRWNYEKREFTNKELFPAPLHERTDTESLIWVIEQDPGYYSENNSWDPYTTMTVYHEREETPAEKEARQLMYEKKKIQYNQRMDKTIRTVMQGIEDTEIIMEGLTDAQKDYMERLARKAVETQMR